MPETKTEPTVVVTLNLPQSIVRQLDALAEASGSGREGAIVDLLQARPLKLAEVLAPVHEDFRKSGMTDSELDELLERELKDYREGR